MPELKVTAIADRKGRLVVVGHGPTQGAADQDARVNLRKIVARSKEPWESFKWLKETKETNDAV